MKLRFALIGWLLLVGVCGFGQSADQPQRLLYFPDTGRSFSALDPGEEILQRNLLISNQAAGYGVSFSLSFDKEAWNGFALGPRYSSIFSLNGKEGCFIRVRTQLNASPDGLLEVVYFLIRGKCYSVYWNSAMKRWDLVENACRAD
ncbi:MAG: hypothetical protein DA408_16350 [Bacteroidetes bacterium]|nr:MAG: hypothetical protein DA408_16350 [Bacteroidota bacterium]